MSRPWAVSLDPFGVVTMDYSVETSAGVILPAHFAKLFKTYPLLRSVDRVHSPRPRQYRM